MTSVARRALGLSLAAGLMFGFGFALVPLYTVFCEWTGINGRGDFRGHYAAADSERWVTVEFVALNRLPQWEFTPAVEKLSVQVGAMQQTHFNARNLASAVRVAQAVPSVSPGRGAAYFNKTECFCFTQQPLQGGEYKQLPLVFFIDAALPDSVNTLTLAYTLYEVGPGS